MNKYKTAITVQRKNCTLTITPYVRAQCGDTENIGFVVTKSDGGIRCHGRTCDEMCEVLRLVEKMIDDSLLED